MKLIHLVFFIILIFILWACSNTTVQKNNTANTFNSNDRVNSKISNNEIWKLESVSLSKFKEELSKNDGILIDLRYYSELKETWIIKGAKQIDFYSDDFNEQLNLLDKNKKYLIYCRSGNRSGQTLDIMKKLWFKNVFELSGWMNAWQAAWEKTEDMSTMNDWSAIKSDDWTEKVITLNAKNWEFDKKIIKAKKWEKLIIKVNNLDGLHWIAFPNMRIMWDNEVEVDTSKTGEFEYRCYNYCGEGHQDMTWKLIIE